MYPVYVDDLERVCEVGSDKLANDITVSLLPEVTTWFIDQGLDPSDHYGSNIWTYYFFVEDYSATFMFSDPKIAMLFKLSYT